MKRLTRLKGRLRPITAADLPVLYDIYASTRAEEVALVPYWTDADKTAFLTQQFNAQHQYYHEVYSAPDFNIIEMNNQVAGRLYLNRYSNDIRIVDIALLPAFRGQGIGTNILQDIFEEAAAKHCKVSIHVEFNNRALNLYQRLGFQAIELRNGVYYLMEWTPAPISTGL
ncbi:MAG: GNAT family N-acetyltransferase [Saprospiraceae bacterium]